MNERGHYGNAARRVDRERGRLVGADPAPIDPRYAARRRAVKAIFYFHDRVRAPLYVYSEVNGVPDASPAGSRDEARSRFSALQQTPAAVYAAIFNVADAVWPDPVLEAYHAAVPDVAPVTAAGDFDTQPGSTWAAMHPPGHPLGPRAAITLGSTFSPADLAADAIIKTLPHAAIPTEGAHYDEVFRSQRQALTQSRGLDKGAPRTTNGDAFALMAYWGKALREATVKPGDLGGLEHAKTLWRALPAANVNLPNDVYAANVDLWHALLAVSTEVSVLAEAPSKWDLASFAIEHAVVTLPETIEEAAKATGKAAAKVFDVGKYLLIGGAVLGGVVLLGFTISKTRGN